MATIPINLTGGTYRHKSLPLSAQVTRNFIPQKQADDKAVSPYALIAYPAKRLFGAAPDGGLDRGMFEHKGILYKVTGEKLYSVDSSGTHVELDDITGTKRCIFAPIGSNIVIETDGVRYQWNGTNLTQITDIDLEDGTGIASLNNQVIYGGEDGRFGVSNVGDATSIDGLNYATAESDADDVVRPYVFGTTLYIMGQKTIELWWNSGQGNPPFDRFEGGVVQVGLGAFHSVANDDDAMFFLGDDHQIYAMRGGSSAVVQPVSTPPMAAEIKKYSTVSDAIGYCLNIDGQSYYIITFPSQDKTWALSIGGEWFELSSGNDGGRDIANSHAYAFRKNLVSDYRNGNIYELTDDVFDDNGEEIVRLRDTAYLHGGLFNAAGKNIEMSRFELILEKGVGLLEGQGEDPVIRKR